MRSLFLETLDVHHGMIERLVVEVGAVANTGLVGIDGVDGVVEHFADLVVVADSETDEREDTQFGREELVTLDRQLFSLTQERVEVPDEVREDMQERLVELLVEVPPAVMGVDIIRDDDEFVGPFFLCFAAYEPLIAFEPRQQVRHAATRGTDILLFDAVGLQQFVVHGLDGALRFSDGTHAVGKDDERDDKSGEEDI